MSPEDKAKRSDELKAHVAYIRRYDDLHPSTDQELYDPTDTAARTAAAQKRKDSSEPGQIAKNEPARRRRRSGPTPIRNPEPTPATPIVPAAPPPPEAAAPAMAEEPEVALTIACAALLAKHTYITIIDCLADLHRAQINEWRKARGYNV